MANEPILIDLRGQRCPLPVMNLRREMKKVQPGARVTALVSDPAAITDVKAFCASAGHDILGDPAQKLDRSPYWEFTIDAAKLIP